jgi:hypothetical protein
VVPGWKIYADDGGGVVFRDSMRRGRK